VTFVIFKGPLQANTGAAVIPAGEQRVQTDLSLESMDWLVEGVIGSTK
jgi:simple sugar transport system substrate-binding protein